MIKTPPIAVLAVITIVCTSACDTHHSSESGPRIIGLAKASMGGNVWDKIEIWHERDQVISASGKTSSYAHWSDLRSLSTLNVGASKDHWMVFNGQNAYACDNPRCEPPRGIPTGMIKSGAYEGAFGFFFPDRFPASIHYERSEIEQGVLFDIVNVAPPGLDSFDVWVDHKTHMIFRLVVAGRLQTDLSEYRRTGDIVVPYVTKENETRFGPKA